MSVTFKEVKRPTKDNVTEVVMLNEETIEERKNKLIEIMKDKGFSSLIVYADKEHGGNFEYLVGFIPRFEEALQILNVDGSSTLILGNENYGRTQYSRLKSEEFKCTLFSLANQPINTEDELDEILKKANIDTSGNVGVVGWKLIPGMDKEFDIPSFIVRSLRDVIGEEKLVNGTGVYIDPTYGARITNNANELAHYEYGASLASDGLLDSYDALEVGITEQEAGELLNKQGQYNNVVTISAFGDRFKLANIYPTDRKLENGDKVALTVSYRGGLSSRSGYAVENLEELEETDKGYYENMVVPYFETYLHWLDNLTIGKDAGEFYREFEEVFPPEIHGWELCPGHLGANEEWMSSPFYDGSDATVKSGMLFQVDFIPISKTHNGVSAESTIAIADEALRKELEKDYPELWARVLERRRYLKEELNIELSEDILPFASTLAYYRPFMLNKDVAMVRK